MKKSALFILTVMLSSCAIQATVGKRSALQNWQFAGDGIAVQTESGTLVAEYPGSLGVMLVDPETYGCDTLLQFQVLPLNPESVLVVMMAASEPGPANTLDLPADYDGGIGHLLNKTEAYFFAFHNAAHNRTPFVRKHPFKRGKSSDLASFSSNVLTTRWHQIELEQSCNGDLRLSVDSDPIIETNDSEPLVTGQIALRLRGTRTHTASALFRNLSISVH